MTTTPKDATIIIVSALISYSWLISLLIASKLKVAASNHTAKTLEINVMLLRLYYKYNINISLISYFCTKQEMSLIIKKCKKLKYLDLNYATPLLTNSNFSVSQSSSNPQSRVPTLKKN